MYNTQFTTSNRKHDKALCTFQLQCFFGSPLKEDNALEKCRLAIPYSRCQSRLYKDVKRSNSHEQKVQPPARSGTIALKKIEVDMHSEMKIERSFLLFQLDQEKIREHHGLLLYLFY